MLKIWTAHFSYRGDDRVDVTVKSSIPPWSVFAPTWDMILNYKRTGDESAYLEQYVPILNAEYNTLAIQSLIKCDDTVTLVCFCRSGAFCHRVILAQFLASHSDVEYYGERK